MLRITLILALIRTVPAMLTLRITIINVNQSIIVFCMLVHIFGGNTITSHIRIAG